MLSKNLLKIFKQINGVKKISPPYTNKIGFVCLVDKAEIAACNFYRKIYLTSS